MTERLVTERLVTERIDPAENNVRQSLEHFAGFGDTEALVSTDGRRYTYAQLRAQIVNTAALLWEQGMRPGMTLAILVAHPPESLFAQFGAHLIGCRTVFFDRVQPLKQVRSVLEAVEVDALLYEMAVSSGPGAVLAREYPDMRVLCIGKGGLGLDVTDPPEPAELPFDLDEITTAPLTLFQTSGTTGPPKLVLHGHTFFKAVGKVAEFYQPGDGRQMRHLLIAGTWHSGSQATAIVTWAIGGALVINGFECSAFLNTLSQERITSSNVSPTMVYMLMDHPGFADFDLSNLHAFTVSTSPMSTTRLIQAAKAFGPSLNVVYGMSELPFIAAFANIGQDLSHPERLTSCGRPWGDVRLEVRDADGSVLPVGELGEIWVTSELMTERYYGSPEYNAKTVVDGWLRTGDVGRVDADGYVYLVDRIADQISYGGYKVHSRPVEDAVAEHPQVRQVAVIGVPDEIMHEVVHAYVVRTPDATVTAEELLAFALENLSDTWAPKTVEFLDAFPLTPYGKVDKKALRALHAAEHAFRADA